MGGRELLDHQRVVRNNIRGKDKHKHMEPWEREEKVWENADGYYISPMTTYADLAQEAKLQGHCGGSHLRFIEAKVTYMYSLRDSKGVPKATIHFKPVEFIGKPQPLDNFPNDAANGNPSGGYAFLKSTTYDGYGGRPNGEFPDFMWEDRPCRILSVSGRGTWSSEGKGQDYRGMVKEWVSAFPVPQSAKVAEAAA